MSTLCRQYLQHRKFLLQFRTGLNLDGFSFCELVPLGCHFVEQEHRPCVSAYALWVAKGRGRCDKDLSSAGSLARQASGYLQLPVKVVKSAVEGNLAIVTISFGSTSARWLLSTPVTLFLTGRLFSSCQTPMWARSAPSTSMAHLCCIALGTQPSLEVRCCPYHQTCDACYHPSPVSLTRLCKFPFPCLKASRRWKTGCWTTLRFKMSDCYLHAADIHNLECSVMPQRRDRAQAQAHRWKTAFS